MSFLITDRAGAMFCPTAVDAFFQGKFSHLDLSLSRSQKLNRSGYQSRVSQEQREKEAGETKRRYPTKIPLVIERHHSERNLPEIDKVSIKDPIKICGNSVCLTSDKVVSSPRYESGPADCGHQTASQVSPSPPALPEAGGQGPAGPALLLLLPLQPVR